METQNFISYTDWINAIKLLNYQIDQININKYYNTLNMFYYNFIKSKYSSILESENYFLNIISSQLFYGMEREIFEYKYFTFKDQFRVRNNSFNSYLSRVIHYANGIYLVKLTSDFYSNFVKQNKNIQSFYGGNISFSDNGDIILNRDRIYYWKAYKKFKNSVTNEILRSTDETVVIKIDIQDFYDNISIDVLTNLIDNTVKASEKTKYKYDYETINRLKNFYSFLSKKGKGIPQGDNDIVSSFLSHLYLTYADLDLEDLINNMKYVSSLKKYKLFRYVDDIYIFLNFKYQIDNSMKEFIVKELIDKIVSLFNQKYELKLNQKSAIYDLSDYNKKKDLTNTIKCTSLIFQDEDSDDEDPQTILDKIFEYLYNLKTSSILLPDDKTNAEELKKVYRKQIVSLLNKKSNRDILLGIFNEFNYALIKGNFAEIIYLILINEESASNFSSYVKSIKVETIRDFSLVIEYLCKTEMKEREKFINIIDNSEYKKIINFDKIDTKNSGYYNLPLKKYQKYSTNQELVNQIIQRRLNEEINNWTLALNHMTNEFKTICYTMCKFDNLTKKREKDFEVVDVKDYLLSKKVDNVLIIQIVNLFDRRNNNGVSHSNGREVQYNEYYNYKKIVEMCISFLHN